MNLLSLFFWSRFCCVAGIATLYEVTAIGPIRRDVGLRVSLVLLLGLLSSKAKNDGDDDFGPVLSTAFSFQFSA